MSLKIEIGFSLNGKPARTSVAPGMSTLEMLRDNFGLCGVKLGCGEGECGACTVLVGGISTNACLMFAVDCAGTELTTIEGLRTDEGLDPLQKSFVEHWAVQCGKCTPGLIMQAKYVLAKNPSANVEEVKRGIEGNLCRCTGYTKIIEAILAQAAPASVKRARNTEKYNGR